MTYQINRKQSRSQLPLRSRAITIARPRPVLDLQLGGALWKDKRISSALKMLAFSVGVLAMTLLVAVDCLMAGWLAGPLAVSQLSISSLALSGGAVLFSTIALLCMSPAAVVHLVRLERGGVIPLRTYRK